MTDKELKKIMADKSLLEQRVNQNEETVLDRDLDVEDYEEDKKPFTGKTRLWMLLLYPDNSNHQKAIESIPSLFPSAIWINHDKCISYETGELKKSHMHYVIYLPNAVYFDHIYKKIQPFDIETRFIRPATNLKKRVRYLCHYDDPDKYQYALEELQGNVKPYLQHFNGEKKRADDGMKILQIIENGRSMTLRDLLREVNEIGCYDEFTRKFYMFSMMYKEKMDEIRSGY